MNHIVLHPASVGLAVYAISALIVLLLGAALRHPHGLLALYHHYLSRTGRERRFLAVTSFYLSFALVRLIAHAIRSGIAPFHNIEIAGRHIHHLVFGIGILLAIGYMWLMPPSAEPQTAFFGRAVSVLYGLGAALTLDEFALWLNLEDVYWARKGRASIDAVFLFGAFMIMSLLGGQFLRALSRRALRPLALLVR